MDSERERICELVDIDINTADRLFKSFDSQKTVDAVEVFTGGRRTTNYKIRLKESGQLFVLRIYPKNDRSWHKEFAVQNMFKDSLPVPEMFYFNEDKSIIDSPFSIVQFLDGITLDKYIQENNCIPGLLAQNIGEILAGIHQKEFVKEGLLDENLNIVEGLPPILLWYDYFLNNRAGARLDSNIRNRLGRLLEENQDNLGEMTRKFVFSHGDFRPENMIVKDGRLIGIIDWEGALSAPAYFDIGQFTRFEGLVSEKAENSFINGYKINAKFPIRDNWKKISRLMDLANILCLLDNEEEKPNLFLDIKNAIVRTLEIFDQ